MMNLNDMINYFSSYFNNMDKNLQEWIQVCTFFSFLIMLAYSAFVIFIMDKGSFIINLLYLVIGIVVFILMFLLGLGIYYYPVICIPITLLLAILLVAFVISLS